MTNALVSELLGRLTARGDTGVYDKAEAALLEAAIAREMLGPDDVIVCKTTVAYFVTAEP